MTSYVCVYAYLWWDLIYIKCFIILFICVCACVYACTSVLWRSKDNLWELTLIFNHAHPKNQTQVFRFAGKHLYLLRYFAGLGFNVFFFML